MRQVRSISSPWELAPDVHAVDAAGDLVVLDVRSDAYLLLPGAAADLTLEPGSGRVRLGDPALAEALRDAGLIAPVSGPPQAHRHPPPPLPEASLCVEGSEALAPGDWLEASRCTFDLARVYRGRSLADLLAVARQDEPAERPETASPGMLAIAARFRRWAPIAPVPGKCLLRAFMLLRLLRREGHDALWVFAVRTWPFSAHCWLQVGDLVLDDCHERLVAFHPILAV